MIVIGQRLEFIIKLLILLYILFSFVVFFEPAISDYLFLPLFFFFLITLIKNKKISAIFKSNIEFLVVIILTYNTLQYAILGGNLRFFIATQYLLSLYLLLRYFDEEFGVKNVIIYAYNLAVILSMVISLIGVLKIANYYNFSFANYIVNDHRIQSLFKDPNVYSAFLIYFVLSRVNNILDNEISDFKKYSFEIFLFFISIIYLILSTSRASFYSLLIGIFLLYILKYFLTKDSKFKITKKLLALIVIICLSIFIVPNLFHENSLYISKFKKLIPFGDRMIIKNKVENNLKETNILQDYDTGGRFVAWKAAFILWRKSPIIGIGPGNFESYSPKIEEKLGAKYITPSVHNLFLRILVENGFLGLILYLYLFLNILIKSLRQGDYVFFSFVIVILLNSLFIDSLHWRHLWYLLALI
ncbi:O-antigen ligase family protein [Carboxydothermus ferrireducens]|uniref:O-antigen ligase n=1 Tax=Carboxydothermus ferrireducens DSM 11255 TaxID=1119529 RepID=A0ABX2RAZ5_9THEO|nr:O-antigen ligase family protein [Carboxydothermus ferrireducens]NYE56948.1 O-antigen ligase [Carboxydothermus ferrireducens DSM 11255]